MFDSDRDELELWLKLACDYSPSIKHFVQRNLLIARIGGVFFVLYSIPWFFARNYPDLAVFSIAAPWLFAFGILTLLYSATIAPAFYRWAYRDTMRGIQKAVVDPGSFGRYTVTATEDALQLKKPAGYDEFPLKNCSLPLATDSFALIGMGPTATLLIPRSRVAAGDYERFVNAIARHTAERRRVPRTNA